MSKKKILTEFFELSNADADPHLLKKENRKKYEDGDEMFLSGKIAEAEKLNGNGRVYPKNILKREIQNYKKLIRENRSLGECVEEGSKVLTDDGWKDFRNLTGDEYIQTLNRETDEIEYQKISRIVDKEPEENYLIHFKNRNIDMKVTSGHRFFLGDVVATAEELFEGQYAGAKIPRDGRGGINIDDVEIEKVPYEGRVYCVTVPNSTFYCMDPHGNEFWSMNCDHPDSSTVHLDNASHLVTRVWWDNGNEVHGNLKILDTDAGKNVKALINGGVKLGISSRGLGSVREEQGDLVVEDDFQLIAFDLVSDPSTTGAFVMEEGQDKTLPDHMTKADRINRKLNNILMT